MFRALAVTATSNICRQRCLHACRQLHTITRKCMQQKQVFTPLQQRLQTRNFSLIPNEEISQEIGEAVDDLDTTDVRWINAVTKFCNKVDLSAEDFFRMNSISPLLEYEETIQHLSDIADVLTDYGYGPTAKTLLFLHVNRFSLTSEECLREALDEYGRDLLVERLKLSNAPRSEFRYANLKYPRTAEAIEHSLSSDKKAFFPWQLLSEHDKSYNKSYPEFFADKLGIDKRVVFAVTSKYSSKAAYLWTFTARAIRLEIEGLEMQDILENFHIVLVDGHFRFMNFVKKIRKLGVDEFLLSCERTRSSELLMEETLCKLFMCTIENFSLKELRYFYGKSKLNAATVFFLMKDEGFHREEIRKNIFLLGVPEKEIRPYMNSYSRRDSKTPIERRKLLRKMKDDLVAGSTPVTTDDKMDEGFLSEKIV